MVDYLWTVTLTALSMVGLVRMVIEIRRSRAQLAALTERVRERERDLLANRHDELPGAPPPIAMLTTTVVHDTPGHPYRASSIDLANDVVESWPPSPLMRCPQCNGAPLQCGRCGKTRTDRELGTPCCDWQEGSKYWAGTFSAKAAQLTFTRGTSPFRLCSPQRRVRVSFLGPRCAQAPGLHTHHRCERCGWTGIAMVSSHETQKI